MTGDGWSVGNNEWQNDAIVQAMTAEMNMHMAKEEEDQSEISNLRKEVNEWKQKYFDCRRKIVAA